MRTNAESINEAGIRENKSAGSRSNCNPVEHDDLEKNEGALRTMIQNMNLRKSKLSSDRFSLEMDQLSSSDRATAILALQSTHGNRYVQLIISQSNLGAKEGNDYGADIASVENFGSAVRSIRGRGDPLPDQTRNHFELRFGHSFSKVRVHTDEKATKLASIVNGRAFTIGDDVLFGAKEYSPLTPSGHRLLAHELAHVVQNDRSGIEIDPTKINPKNHPSEVQAREAIKPGPMPALDVAPVGLALEEDATSIPEDTIKGSPFELDTIQGKGNDPASLRLNVGSPNGDISKEKDIKMVDVKRGMASTITRSLVYLQNFQSEIMMAVTDFKSTAQSQIEALPGDPSDYWGLLPLLAGAVLAGIAVACPAFGIGSIIIGTLAAGGQTVAVATVKGGRGDLKRSAIDGLNAFAISESNKQTAMIARIGNDSLPTQLNDLAASDSNVLEMLELGGDLEIDTIIRMLGVPDRNTQSPYGTVLTALMVSFSEWLSTQQYQKGMTKSERMISESAPGSESYEEMHSQIKAARDASKDKAREMAEEHNEGRRKPFYE
jgi:hypothetical protein